METPTQNETVTASTTSEGTVSNVQEGVQGATVTTPSPESGAEPSKVAEAKVGGTLDTPAETPYTPNLKYKVKDKELEMPEWVKEAVKDKKREDELRDLFTKAMGLDEVKKERDEIKTNFTKLEPEYKQLTQSLDVLSQYVNKGEYGKFFQALRIPEEKILGYAVERLKYYNLPDEERAKVDARMQEQERLYSLSEHNQTLEQRFQAQMVQNKELEYSVAVMKPEVAQFVQNFEAMVGKPGAFRDKVVEKGILLHQMQGVDLPAEQVVQMVMQEFSGFIKPAAVESQSTQRVTAEGIPVVQNKKPVIPTITNASGTGSPVKRQFTSLKEIREYAQSRNS